MFVRAGHALFNAYSQAIYLALLDRSKRLVKDEDAEFPLLGSSPPKMEEKAEEVKQVIYILGAGQGPFVDASLQASQRAKVPVRVFVVEKNPNALLTLRVSSPSLSIELHYTFM